MKATTKAVIMLTAFTVAERTLGFLFKIYLSREIGAVNMGIYSVALSFFFVLLTLLTSGIPLVVSKLTAKGGRKESSGLCTAALIVELITTAVICLAVLGAQNPIGALFADSRSMKLVLIMLPALLFSGIYSSFRGVLWGEKKFTAVSVVELIEQVARIVACVALFNIISDKLSAVALSMTVACCAAALACTAAYFWGKRTLSSPKAYFKPLLSSSVPITASRATSSVNSYITAVAIPFLLMSTGLNSDQSMYVFGSCVGMALPLLYMPITVVGSLAFVMIPTLSEAYAKNDKKSMCSQIESALSFSILIAAIALPVFGALGDDIGSVLYDNTDAGIFLKRSAWLLLPLSFENIASSMLNSLDLEKKSLINYLAGAGVTYAISFCFYGRFTMNIFMVAFGAGLTVSSALDVIDIKKRSGARLTFFRPLLVCLCAAYPVWLFTEYVNGIIPGGILSMLIAAVSGVCAMALLSVVFGAADVDISLSKRHKRSAKGLPPA